MAELIRTVHITDDDGEVHTFRPGDTIPAELLHKASNPRLWSDGESPTGAAAPGDDDSAEPPRNGAGSGKDAWASYAESIGVQFEADATRDEIIAAVDASRDDQ